MLVHSNLQKKRQAHTPSFVILITLILSSCYNRPYVADIKCGKQLNSASEGSYNDVLNLISRSDIPRKVCGSQFEIFFLTKDSLYFGKRNNLVDCKKITKLFKFPLSMLTNEQVSKIKTMYDIDRAEGFRLYKEFSCIDAR